MSGVLDSLSRRVAPRLLAAGASQSRPAQLNAALQRRRGEHGRLELFFAFDDPCSAVALLDLCERLRSRPVDVLILPVVRRGIPGDPAVEQKRSYALVDARRLARRHGWSLARSTPLPAEWTAFLAEWVAATEACPELLGFCESAMRRLWLTDQEPPSREAFAALWREHLGREPRADAAAVRRCEARRARRGPYETPAVWVAGRWYFAHDRPAQICEWLDTLGWTAP